MRQLISCAFSVAFSALCAALAAVSSAFSAVCAYENFSSTNNRWPESTQRGEREGDMLPFRVELDFELRLFHISLIYHYLRVSLGFSQLLLFYSLLLLLGQHSPRGSSSSNCNCSGRSCRGENNTQIRAVFSWCIIRMSQFHTKCTRQHRKHNNDKKPLFVIVIAMIWRSSAIIPAVNRCRKPTTWSERAPPFCTFPDDPTRAISLWASLLRGSGSDGGRSFDVVFDLRKSRSQGALNIEATNAICIKATRKTRDILLKSKNPVYSA